MKWARYVAGMGEIKTTYNILVRRPEEKSPFGGSEYWGKIILKLI
jgi:hypothetical protein